MKLSFVTQLLICILLFAISTAAYAAEAAAQASVENSTEVSTVNLVLLRQQQIASQIKLQDPVWLKTSEGDWLALYREDETGKKLGTVLLIPDKGLESSQPGIISFLAKSLTRKGWSTLTISLPSETADSDALSQSILSASFKHLKQLKSGDIFLLLQGDQQNIFNRLPQITKGAVLLNLLADNKTKLPEAFKTSPIPLLDIIATRDRNMIKTAWQRRKNLAHSSQLPYRQLVFNGMNQKFSGMEQNLSRVISAWLNKNYEEE